MESASSPKQPEVPGPNAGHGIPPASAGKAAIPLQPKKYDGVSVPVYPKLPDRPVAHVTYQYQTEVSYPLIFDAFLALVSVAFCILFFSEL